METKVIAGVHGVEASDVVVSKDGNIRLGEVVIFPWENFTPGRAAIEIGHAMARAGRRVMREHQLRQALEATS